MAITTNLSTLKIHKLTQAQYDTAVANGNIDETALYLTPEEEDSTGENKSVWYGTCPTAASTTAKVVTTDTGDFSLIAGKIIYVLFTYQAPASATLNVDGTGAKSIKTVATTNVVANQWGANEVVGFVYDGTYFRMIDGMTATTTYYGMTKLSSSTSSTSTSLAATPSAVKSAYDLANAAMPKAGGTMTGALTAQTNANYTTAQMRNVIYLEEGATVPSTSNGDLVLFYK